MLLIFAVLLCAVDYAEPACPEPIVPKDPCILTNDVNVEFYDCHASGTGLKEQTWYQDGAFLKVTNGIFTIELLADDSSPKAFYAEEKGIAVVQEGFATIPSLEWLSLESNLIEEIEGPAFQGLSGLAYLSLARNRISYLVEDSFKGLNKLEVLNLDHNALRSIRFSVSNSVLPALTQLHLQHNQLEYIRVDSYSDQHKFLCDSNLRHLYLSNNSLNPVRLNEGPTSICLERLTHLFLDYNQLEQFEIGTLKLEALSLDGNQMWAIPQVNPEMRFLSMTKNRVQYISGLKNAVNISRIILSYNNLNWDFRVSEEFQNLSSLEHIALDHNQLEFITGDLFYNLTSLKRLQLNDNSISEISPTGFVKLPALREVDLSNNQISHFPGNVSFGQSNLTCLDLSYNKVENVSNLQVNMIPKLKTLRLTGNPLKRIEGNSVSSDTEILF